MVALHDDGEVTSAASAVDLERPLAEPLPPADLRLEHGLHLAHPTEAVDLHRVAGSSASPPRLHKIRLLDGRICRLVGRIRRLLGPSFRLGRGQRHAQEKLGLPLPRHLRYPPPVFSVSLFHSDSTLILKCYINSNDLFIH